MPDPKRRDPRLGIPTQFTADPPRAAGRGGAEPLARRVPVLHLMAMAGARLDSA